MRGTATKIFAPWRNVAWGASGHVGVIQRVSDHLDSRFSNASQFDRKTAAQIRSAVVREVATVIRDLHQNQLMTGAPGARPWCSFLFAGCAADRPFIVEIGQDLSDQDHTSTGYSAIGSGDIFPYVALASLAHFEVKSRSLLETKLIAHRIMDDAIKIAAHYLGPPIQMIEIPCSDPVHAKKLSDDDLRVISDKVTEWKEVEKEVLTDVVGVAPPAGEATTETTEPAAGAQDDGT